MNKMVKLLAIGAAVFTAVGLVRFGKYLDKKIEKEEPERYSALRRSRSQNLKA